MPTYEEPTDQMKSAFEAERARDCHRERLADVNIVVKAAYASRNKDNEPRGEALSQDGDPVLGVIKITSLLDRSDDSSDVRIVLHGDRWGGISWGMQCSVIDTCLTRIEVQMSDGYPKRDDLGRPLLRKKKWGYKLCGFPEVDERHGKSSIGVHSMQIFFSEHGQYYMPFLHEEPPEDFMAVPVRPKQPKLEASSEHKRGKLSVGALETRIEHLTERATLLGVYKLELREKAPRSRIIDAVRAKVLSGKFLPDFIAVEKNETPSVEPDLAAAVLVTSKARPGLDLLGRMVPDCRDTQVLGWILDDEDEEEPRDAVLDVVNGRILELSS